MTPYIIFKKNDQTVAIADNCNLFAAIFHFVWVLYHGLWQLFLLFGLYIFAVAMLHHYQIFPDNLYYFSIIVALIYLWAYGNFWRQLKFKRKGFRVTKMVMAKNEDEAIYKAL